MHEIFLTINKKSNVFYSLETPRDENISPQTNFTQKYPMVIFPNYGKVCTCAVRVTAMNHYIFIIIYALLLVTPTIKYG